MSVKELNNYIDEVVTNIREDRETTKELLDDAMKWLAKDESRHQQIGLVLSKYVETLQRSNDQLVRVVNMVSKNTSDKGLSEEDKNDLLDMISKETEKDV
tara:strand:+ start:2760 stop:3059 length:300 start_codon:yes stop_codon:yes gene_type:complete